MAAPIGTDHHHDRMSGQAWALFAAMSVIWGLPYLFIKIAVEQIPPSAVVLGRTALAALVLVPSPCTPGRCVKQPGTGARWLCSPCSRWGSRGSSWATPSNASRAPWPD